MPTTIDTRHDGRLQLSVESWHLAGASAQDSDSCHPAQFDMASAATVVGPGEDCLVCDEPLTAGEVFVLGTWDGRSGPIADAGTSDCIPYSLARLAERTFVFDGTVTAVGDDVSNRPGMGQLSLAGVTFTVNEWYRGDGPVSVTVDLPRSASAG